MAAIGGAGATQKALASGVPVCVVPFGCDQLEVARRVEVVRRRSTALDHAVIGQLERRSVAFSHGARSTGVLLSQLLRISRPEAAARVKAAAALGARVTVTGQPVEPKFPACNFF